MPETYNVRDRSFIKVPEPKVCITCGHSLAPEVKPMSNFMNKYINDINGSVVILNSNEEYVELQGVKLRRSNIEKPVEKPVEVAKTPTPSAKVVNPPTK